MTSKQDDDSKKAHKDKPLGVAVHTPSGIYPNDDDYHRAESGDKINHILKKTAKHLQLTDTSNWVVYGPDGNELDPNKTYADYNLKCVVEIEWQPREGGGGCM